MEYIFMGGFEAGGNRRASKGGEMGGERQLQGEMAGNGAEGIWR